MWAAGPVMVWCFWCDTQSKSWWIPPQLVLMIFQYHGDLFFQGVHCFLFSSHSIEFYFLLSFLFSCFKVGLCATQFLEAFRVLYPPHPRPVSLSMAKFKFIIFGQGPNSGFFNSVFHSHPQRLIVWHIRTSNLSILFLFFRCKGTPSHEEGLGLSPRNVTSHYCNIIVI